jgi:hypothetical protein
MNTKEALEIGLSRQLRELYEEKHRLEAALYHINTRIREVKDQEAENMPEDTSEKDSQGYYIGGIVTGTPPIHEELGSVVFFTGEQEDSKLAPKKYCLTPMEDYQRYDSH